MLRESLRRIAHALVHEGQARSRPLAREPFGEDEMFKKFLPKAPRTGRRYPIKRDALGKTARQRAFALFDKGLRPGSVAPMVDVTLATIYTYSKQWKKLPPNRDLEYKMYYKRSRLNEEIWIWNF